MLDALGERPCRWQPVRAITDFATVCDTNAESAPERWFSVFPVCPAHHGGNDLEGHGLCFTRAKLDLLRVGGESDDRLARRASGGVRRRRARARDGARSFRRRSRGADAVHAARTWRRSLA